MSDRQRIDISILEDDLQSIENKLQYARPLSDEDRAELTRRRERKEAELKTLKEDYNA